MLAAAAASVSLIPRKDPNVIEVENSVDWDRVAGSIDWLRKEAPAGSAGEAVGDHLGKLSYNSHNLDQSIKAYESEVARQGELDTDLTIAFASWLATSDDDRFSAAALKLLKQLPPSERRGMEGLSTVLDFYNFTAAAQSLAAPQGFDAARDILSSASLTPDKYEMAAASIAAAKIGPETKDRAAWLLENLRSDEGRALGLFTSSWTQGNHPEAANWIATMQPGLQRDAALKGFVPSAARIDGATAMDWALTVSDPLLRNQLYCETHEKWKETDAEQANQYHDAHPLDREALDAASE